MSIPHRGPVRVLLTLGLGLLLVACGGGSGGSSPPASGLPASVALQVPLTVEVAAATALATDVPADATGLRFSWEFGDGQRSAEARPSHAYAQAGRYTLRVVVSDGTGRQVSAQAVLQAVPALRLHGLRCSGADGSGWCRQLPLAWKPVVRAVQLLDARQAWAVADDGWLLQSSDGGATWAERVLPGQPRLSQVQFSTPREGWLLGWALGGDSRAWRTRDGGATWVPVAPVPVAHARRLHRVTDEVVLVWGSVPGAAPAITEDGGQTWRVPGLDVRHVEADGTLWGLPVTPPGGTYDERPGVAFRKSSDRGRSFVDEPGWPADGTVDWMGVAEGGWAWALSSRWVGREFDSRRVQGLWLRRGAGAAWQAAPLPAAGDVSQIVVTPDGAQATLQDPGTFALTLWSTDDPRQGWQRRDWPWPANERTAGSSLLDGRSLQAFRSRTEWPWVSLDAGRSWVQADAGQALPDGQAFRFDAVRRTPGGLLLQTESMACALEGHCSSWYRSDDGRRWQPVWAAARAAASQRIGSLWFRNTARGLALTRTGSLLATDDGGRSWRAQDPALPAGGDGSPLSRLQAAPDGSLWGLAGGRLVRSADDGRSWAPAPAQPDPAAAPGQGLTDFGWIDGTRLFALRTECFFSPHRPASCTTRPWRSDDGARSWRALPGIGCERLSFLSARQAVCLARTAHLFSSDGGETWAAAAGPGLPGGLVAVQRGAGAGPAPGPVWALGPAGLLRSDDEGRSWQAVALPAPPLRLNADDRPETAGLQAMAWAGLRGWLVGDEGWVLASTDGGQTWAQQPSGVQAPLGAVFALDADNLWVAAGTTVLATATGGR